MLKFGVILLFLVYLPTAVTETCAACKATFDTDKPLATDEAAICAVLATYLHCLEGSGKDDAGCPLVTAEADATEFDYIDFSCSGKAAFTDTCGIYGHLHMSGGILEDRSKCCAATAYIACLKGKTALACDCSTTVAALAAGVETRITALGSTDCAVTTACQCEINAARADISSDATKCSAYKAQYACLYPLTTAPCVGTIADLKTAAATSVTSTTSCTFDDTCVCQRAFDAAKKGTDVLMRNALCQCEVNAAKGDASTSAKYCTVLTTLKTCLSAITTTTEEGCTATTQAALLTDTNTKITTATCGSAADHVTLATTSLIVSVLVNMFL